MNSSYFCSVHAAAQVFYVIGWQVVTSVFPARPVVLIILSALFLQG